LKKKAFRLIEIIVNLTLKVGNIHINYLENDENRAHKTSCLSRLLDTAARKKGKLKNNKKSSKKALTLKLL